MENCYKILSILITVYFCFAGTDDTLTPGKTESDTGPEVREEIVRRLNEEYEKDVKENKDTSDFELPAEICQPLDLKYPKRNFENGPERSFCKEWYRKFPWLHYDEKRDAVFCFTCMNAANKQKLRVSTKQDDAFIARGYKNWKRGTTGFKTHESSECHREAIEVIELPRKCADIGEKLSAYHSEEKQKNRQIFLTILRNICFLARQGLALRGNIEEESNFIQLLKLEGEMDSRIEKWLKKKSGKYTHPEIQNECLQLMSLTILREISENIQNSVYYTIRADEVTDSSNKEQFVVCLRWVDHDLVTHEELVGRYAVDNITSETLVNSLKDVLLRMGLSVQNCRGQCYDGANNMVGCKSGVATQIQKRNPVPSLLTVMDTLYS